MRNPEINGQEDVFTRSPKVIFSDSTHQKKNSPTLLPTILCRALNIYCLDLANKHGTKSERNNISQGANYCLKIKLFAVHLIVLMYLPLALVDSPDHATFIVTTEIDFMCYLLTMDLLLYRKEKIIQCLKSLQEIPCTTSEQRKANKKLHKTTVLVATSLLYTAIYIAYGLYLRFAVLYVYDEDFQLGFKIVDFVYYIFYCVFTCMGIAVQFALFVQFATLISDRLLPVEKELRRQFDKGYTEKAIREQCFIFCKVQNILTSADSIFSGICFMWLTKILIRVCLSAIDVLTRPWPDTGLSTQVIVVFDILFDLSHLVLLCVYGDKVRRGKDRVLDSLVYAGAKLSSCSESMQNEIHYFISLVSHSQVYFTAFRIFCISKNTALTILGILASHCVIIYQFTSQ